MPEIAAELLVNRLIQWGVDTVFGLPGDGINGIMEALRRHRNEIEFFLVRHEEAAAFMACGYAKATGRLGVCLATSGPGGVHLMNGLYDAKLDHHPVLAITGMQETAVLGTGYQQEVHLEKLMDLVGDYSQMVYNPQQLPTLVDIAIRHALTRRTVAHITIPTDVQIAAASEDPYSHVAPARSPSTAPIWLPPPVRPREEELRAAASVLNSSSKIAILAGWGALHARDELLAVADTLAAPIVKTLPGKAVVPDDSPYTTGGIGLLGTKTSEEVMEECRTLFMVGTNFPYTKHLPKPGQVKVVQIEADPVRAGVRIPTDVPVIGDVKEALRGLLPLLERNGDRRFLESAQESMNDWRKNMAALENVDRDPIAPQYLMHCIDELATDDAILTCDSGTIATWAARHWTIRGDRQFYLSGNLATMAPGLPYAIAMQHAFPSRQVIAFVGDGGFSMLMAEFMTACTAGLPIKVVINDNNEYGQILWEQMVLGYPEYGVRHHGHAPDFSKWAEGCGGWGKLIQKPKDLMGAVREMLAHPGPALLDVRVNPNEPPMPGKITYHQAQKFTEAFLKGQPQKVSTATTIALDKIEQLKA